MTDHRYTPPQASLEPHLSPADGEPPSGHVPPKPIGGWLYLVGFGLIVSPFTLAYTLLTHHWPIFRDGTWTRLTTPGTAAYHPLWGPMILLESLGNLVLLGLVATALALFLKKSRKAPRFVIAWFASGAVIMIVDQLLGNAIPAVAAAATPAQYKELVRSLLSASIWIPYFLVSKRVKSTFTR